MYYNTKYYILCFVGYESSHRARELVHYIANEKLVSTLCSVNAFSVLSDGSQVRKTGSEKELVLVRVVRNGMPVFYSVALQDIDEFGDANADNLTRQIDDTFLNKSKVAIPRDQYTKHTCVCHS